MDNVQKIVDYVLDYCEDEVGENSYSLIPVSCSDITIVRVVTRLRKTKQFYSVTYELDPDEDGKYLVKVVYLKKKDKHIEKNKKRRK